MIQIPTIQYTGEFGHSPQIFEIYHNRTKSPKRITDIEVYYAEEAKMPDVQLEANRNFFTDVISRDYWVKKSGAGPGTDARPKNDVADISFHDDHIYVLRKDRKVIQKYALDGTLDDTEIDIGPSVISGNHVFSALVILPREENATHAGIKVLSTGTRNAQGTFTSRPKIIQLTFAGVNENNDLDVNAISRTTQTWDAFGYNPAYNSYFFTNKADRRNVWIRYNGTYYFNWTLSAQQKGSMASGGPGNSNLFFYYGATDNTRTTETIYMVRNFGHRDLFDPSGDDSTPNFGLAYHPRSDTSDILVYAVENKRGSDFQVVAAYDNEDDLTPRRDLFLIQNPPLTGGGGGNSSGEVNAQLLDEPITILPDEKLRLFATPHESDETDIDIRIKAVIND